jgi:P2-related tail formation protein
VTDTKVPAKTTPRATKPVSAPFDVEAALKQWTETARKATDDTLELYVKTVHQLADAEVEAAQAIKLPIVATIAETNAAVSRRIASAYVAAARDLLKA